jgi:putative hemolysin
MKRILTSIIMLIVLTACTAPRAHGTPKSVTTDMPLANMPNPASVYCEQQGNKLEIVTAADGSQSGVCIFPDGSTCDEWAHYRGECGPGAQPDPTSMMIVTSTTEQVMDWWGVIKQTEPGAQYDDYFERQDLGQVIYFGIDAMNPEIKAQIESLRDSGHIVHLYGTLVSNVPDYNGSRIVVERVEIEK